MKNAECKNKKFGHDFPYPGANCLRCGVNQLELNKKPIAFKVKTNRYLHSNLHLLVDDIRNYFGETAKKGKGSFGFYLGFLKKIGDEKIYEIFSEAKSAKGDKKRYFWWKIGQLMKKQK